MPDATSPLVDALTEINLVDLLDSTGLSCLQGTPLRRLFLPLARRFALTAHEFDARVGTRGLAGGSAWLMAQMTAGLRVSGQEHIPPHGPVFILANHPGMTDTVALFASLASRPDLKVIALERPFLRALPHVAQQLIFLPLEGPGRMAAIRAGARHLKDGGALLTFPAGDIEPDPATSSPQRTAESLQNWSTSYALFARMVPETRFVPALVSHVISPAAQRNPLTLLRRSSHDKARLAAALQVAWPSYRNLAARVAFGAPPKARQGDTQALCNAVAGQMRQLMLAQPSPDWLEAPLPEPAG